MMSFMCSIGSLSKGSSGLQEVLAAYYDKFCRTHDVLQSNFVWTSNKFSINIDTTVTELLFIVVCYQQQWSSRYTG